MKNRISIQYTVSPSILSSISYRLARLFCNPSLRRLQGRRRGAFPPVRANVIKTRTPQWEWIWLSAALVAVLLAAGICAGIYLDQHLHRALEAVPASSIQSASTPAIRNVSERRAVHRASGASALLRTRALGV